MWEYLKFWSAKSLWDFGVVLLFFVVIILAYVIYDFWYFSRWSKASKSMRVEILEAMTRGGNEPCDAFNLEVYIVGLSKMGTPDPYATMFRVTIARLLKQGVIRKCIVRDGRDGYELVTDAFKVGE